MVNDTIHSHTESDIIQAISSTYGKPENTFPQITADLELNVVPT